MRRPSYFVVGVLAAGLIAACAYVYRVPLGLTGPAGNREGVLWDRSNSGLLPAQIRWQKIDRPSDGFALEMPAGSEVIQIPAYDRQGLAEPVNMIQASIDPATTYAVTWADNPPVKRAGPENPDKTLDAARSGALIRTQSTLTAESRSSLAGYPARDFSGRNFDGGVFNARLILAGNRLYMLIAAFPASSARRDEDVKRFFDSFVITPSSRRN